MGAFPNHTISVVSNSKCILGEGPIWDPTNNCLYWVDIFGKEIFRLHPESKSIDSWKVEEYIGFVIPKDENVLLAGLKSGLHKLTLNVDGTVISERIDSVDDENSNIRFNDACITPDGGFMACTMDMEGESPLGKLFYYNNKLERKIIDSGYIIANGPCLSPDKKLVYIVETAGNGLVAKGVYVAKLVEQKELENTRLLIDWKNFASSPDGIICDSKGNLWVGEFGGNTLRCFLPDGSLYAEIALPAFNVTKAAIGGANNDKLYVTSACIGTDESTLGKYPHTGKVLEIHNVLN